MVQITISVPFKVLIVAWISQIPPATQYCFEYTVLVGRGSTSGFHFITVIISIYLCVCACVLSSSVMSYSFVTLWTVVWQVPLSMGFSQSEYWSGMPFPPPGDLSGPGSPVSPASSCIGRQILYHWAIWEALSVCLSICLSIIYHFPFYLSIYLPSTVIIVLIPWAKEPLWGLLWLPRCLFQLCFLELEK